MTWSEWLYHWQDLAGAFLGPFLAVILSAVGFWFKSIIERRREVAEAHRRIEVAVARSLNDAHVLRAQIKWFVGRIKALAAEARAVTNPKEYFLSRINFPQMREIYRDDDMGRFKVRSYYIHNKLLFLDAGIKATNEVVTALKEDFEEIIRQNGLLVALLKDNPNPPVQRETYANNLSAFADGLESYIEEGINPGVKVMVQTRVYNGLLRKRFGYRTWWKHEGTWMKYFRTKKQQRDFARNLDSLDTIDAKIEPEVQKELEKAEDREKKVFNGTKS